MENQHLFEALQNVCGFTALESDIFEIIAAYEKDKSIISETAEQKEKIQIPSKRIHCHLLVGKTNKMIKLKKIRYAFRLWGTANWYQGIDKPTFWQWTYVWRMSWKTSWKVATIVYG